MVERHLAKVNVASSNLVFRSKKAPTKVGVFLAKREMRTSRVRRSSPKAAIGFWDCGVGSTKFLPDTARSRRKKRERTVPSLPLQKAPTLLVFFFMRKIRDENEQSSSEQPGSRDRLSGLWSREHEVNFRKRLAAVGNKRERTVPSLPLQKSTNFVGVFFYAENTR